MAIGPARNSPELSAGLNLFAVAAGRFWADSLKALKVRRLLAVKEVRGVSAIAGAKSFAVGPKPDVRHVLDPSVFQSITAGVPPNCLGQQRVAQIIHVPA